MWKLVSDNGLELCLVYHSEKCIWECGRAVCIRPILSLAKTNNGFVFYGDEGSNLKLFNLKTGVPLLFNVFF